MTEPLHDIVAEQAVLGSMILNEGVIADMAALLRGGDFYRPVHGTIFDVVVGMFSKGLPVDRLTLLSRLIETGELARCGGAPYLHTLIEYANPPAAATYARTVADRATDRALGELGAQASLMATTPGETASKVSLIRDAADGLTAHREIRHGVWVRDAMGDAIDAIEAARSGEVQAGVIPTPYRDLTRLLGGGIRPGQSLVIGARPGIGKSTVLLDFLRTATAHAFASDMITLEMSVPEIMQRFLSAETGIPYAMIRTGQIHPDEEYRLADQVQRMMDMPLKVTDAPGATMGFVRAQVRRGVARDGLRLYGVDYLGLMGLNPKVDSRREGLGEISRGIKTLNMELGISSITCSQLNRNPAGRADKRPELSDLRETGDIEQDADIVILLHDPTGGDPVHERSGEYDLIVAKHRGGPTGTITVTNQLHRARLADMMIV